MHVLRLQTCIVWFLSLFSEGLMCMGQNFKLFCCATYILNLIVSICLSCWPNMWCSGVFSAEFRSFRKNSAKPDISRKYCSASRIFWKIRLRGLRSSTSWNVKCNSFTFTGTATASTLLLFDQHMFISSSQINNIIHHKDIRWYLHKSIYNAVSHKVTIDKVQWVTLLLGQELLLRTNSGLRTNFIS